MTATRDFRIRTLLGIALTAIACFGARWFGETPGAVEGDIRNLGMICVVSALAAGVLPWSLRVRLSTGAAIIVLACALFVSGRVELVNAFNECVDQGESVRTALAKYRLDHAAFPAEASDVSEKPSPRRRLLRGDLMQYRRTDAGYSLDFTDGLVSFHASDEDPFIAHK